MRLKEMTNSRRKVWEVLTDGMVTPPARKGWKMPLRAKAAQMEPEICAMMYAGTWTHGKWRNPANAMVTAGFTWAPEMWPVAKMTIITASPAHPALPMRPVGWPYFWFTIGAAVAKKMRMKVPTNSAATCSYSCVIIN